MISCQSVSFNDRLKSERLRINLNQTDFASIAGVTKKTQMLYEKGDRSPDVKYMSAIAAEGVDVNFIITGNRSVSGNELAVAQSLITNNANIGSLTQLPYLDIEASAGHGAIVEHEETSFMVAFDRDWLRREVGVAPQHLRLIKARGDSMNSGKGLGSDIYDDDILLVDTSVERIESDAAYIIQFDGCLVVKRMQKMFDGSVSIISSNPEYATQIVSVEQTPDIRIAGKVVYMIAGRRV